MPDIDLDPRDLPCDMLVLLDDVFTLGDSISFEQGGIWADYERWHEAYVAYFKKMGDVERKISAEFFKPILNVANMLFRWQTDKVIRLVIFCNKDTANV